MIFKKLNIVGIHNILYENLTKIEIHITYKRLLTNNNKIDVVIT